MTRMTQADMAAHDRTTWKLFEDCSRAESRVDQYVALVAKAQLPGAAGYYANHLGEYEDYLAEAQAKLKQITDALDAHERNYAGWSRFWCVPNGHIHRTMSCSTCNKMGNRTRFYLAHEVSGMDEAAAVNAQGPVLCTVCFPTAPLNWTNGLDEAAKAKKAAQCPGSGRYYDSNLPHESRRMAKWATCPECGDRPAMTSTGKLRAHKPKG